MKKVLGVLLLSLSLASFTSAQTMTDRETDGLKGKVKSVRVESAHVSKRDGQAFESSRRLQSEATYDEKGNKLEEIRYNSRGAIEERVVSGRDEKGHPTKTQYKADGTIASKWVFNYDAKGKMTGGAQYAADGTLQLKMVREFDANGKFISGAMYDVNGALMNKTVSVYDAQGKQAKDTVYNAAGALLQELVRAGGVDTVTMYDSDGTIRYKAVSQSPAVESDSNGNWIKRSTPMTTTQRGKTEEGIEVVYRTITYANQE